MVRIRRFNHTAVFGIILRGWDVLVSVALAIDRKADSVRFQQVGGAFSFFLLVLF